MSRRKSSSVGCDLNMTPMIDVVFQLIIFFVVTSTLTKEKNREIILEDGKHGEIIKDQTSDTLVIEIDRRGGISICNGKMGIGRLRQIVQSRYNHYGSFPVLIRADRRTEHNDVKAVMDICTRIGIWKVGFVAVQERFEK